MKLLFFLVGVFGFFAAVSSIELVVPGYGTLLGTEGESANLKRTFHAFRSVYYAEPPTEEHRFLPPTPKAAYPEDEIVNATRPNIGCTQHLGTSTVGEEDCLSLDIYTPVKLEEGPPSKLLPVMVWIHGGSFRSGQTVIYLPIRYMDEDIVLVAVQYRLGPLGFLSLDTDDVPGNAGIFDQIEALRWVNKHIEAFGGDPNQVTIVGESAGSASVSLLLLAPQARGLFHRAVGESGSVLAEWAIDKDGKTPSTRVAEIAGCPLDPYPELLNCLRTIPAHNLTEAQRAYWLEEELNGGLGFGASNPVIQKAGKERIIEVEPRKLFESGNYSMVPVMFGANQQEGVLVLTYMYRDFLVPNNLVENATFLEQDLVPYVLKALNIRDDTGTFADALTDKYFVDAEMGNFTSMTPGIIDMLGALFLKSAGLETIRLISKNVSDAYWYSFDYEGRLSMYGWLFPGEASEYPWDHGVCHGDEMIYLFAFPFPGQDPSTLNDEELELSKKMVKAWTNFVKTGNPNGDIDGVPEWPRYERATDQYLAIDKEWVVKTDYTDTYTVTVDELRPTKAKKTPRKTLRARGSSIYFSD